MLLGRHLFILTALLTQVPGFLAIPSSPEEPCRSPCLRNALFKAQDKGFVLRGHVIAAYDVSSPFDCTQKCTQEPRCKSINTEHTTNKPTTLCELNYETKETKPAFYVKRTGYTYHDAMGPGDGWCHSVCLSPYGTGLCPEGFAGEGCQTPMKTCVDWLNHGFKKDGIYHVVLKGYKTVPVYCDQTTDEGGWTVVQRRIDGAVDFYRGWHDYKTGFGDVTKEFWFGNDFIHLLTTSPGVMELRVDIETFQGDQAYAKYNRFNISNEESNYTLSVSGYTGSAGDSFGKESGNTLENTINNNMAFSTWDRDNDKHKTGGACAVETKGAWWFNDCYWSHLNGPYKGPRQSHGINWYSFAPSNYESLKQCSMKIRPAP